MEEKILNLLTQPMKTGEVAEATGIEKKEVEKIIKKARQGGAKWSRRNAATMRQ